MKNKYLAFAKNMGISAVAGLAVGAGSAELADMLTDNQTATAIISTVSEYAAAYGTFMPLHARDNRDLYMAEDGRFRWGYFIKDQIKLVGGLFVLDIAYLLGRPVLTKEFLQEGLDPAKASLYSDAICYSIFGVLVVPIGRITGAIRSRKASLEDEVKKRIGGK